MGNNLTDCCCAAIPEGENNTLDAPKHKQAM